jgi:hypothetical protein
MEGDTPPARSELLNQKKPTKILVAFIVAPLAYAREQITAIGIVLLYGAGQAWPHVLGDFRLAVRPPCSRNISQPRGKRCSRRTDAPARSVVPSSSAESR